MEEEELPQKDQPDEKGNADKTPSSASPEPPDKAGSKIATANKQSEPAKGRRILVEIVKDDTLTSFEKRMFWLTLVGAILAGLTGFVFYMQFRKMSQQTTILGNQVKAAQDNTTALKTEMRVDQRAWVGAGSISYKFDANSPVIVNAVGKNTGKTPALQTSSEIYWVVKPNFMGPIALKDLVYGPSAVKVNDGTVFPTQTFGINFTQLKVMQNQAEIFKRLADESSTLYIYWLVNYTDIFGGVHWTHFCYRVYMGSGGVTQCAIYNDSDPEYQQ